MRRRGGHKTGHALQLLLHRDTTLATLRRALAAIDPVAFVDLATAHRVAAVAHALLTEGPFAGEHGLSPEVIDRLETQRQRARMMHLMTTRIAQLLAKELPSSWVVVKGPALARWYGSPDHRTYGDLDVLVSRRSFRRSLDALSAAGHGELNHNWTGFLDHGVAEVPVDCGPVTVDLHWHLLALRAHRDSIGLDSEAMLERRVPVQLGNQSFHTLDPEDTLLHLCAHGGLGGARRLIWLVDVDRVVTSGAIDWPVFVDRARASRLAGLCVTMLAQARRLLGTPLPDQVVGDLEPFPGLLRTLHLSTRPARDDQRRLDGWQSGILQHSARDTRTETARQLWSAMINEYARRSGGAAVGGAGGDLDWRVMRGGPEGRTAWLDYVDSDRP